MSAKRYLAPWGRSAAAWRAAVGGGGGALDVEALAALEGKAALYHCVSRAVWREKVFGAAEKEKFVRVLRKWEAFSRVRVLTYCVMGNHFHVLVEVPERPAKDPSDEELLEHLGIIYGAKQLAAIRWELEQYRGQGSHAAAEALRQRFLRRMWNLSVFMKAVKQDFTVWWTRRQGKEGNLWQDKFKSVLVEEGHAARVVAGYIDLNPVRAGMVKEAAAYRWSGWGEACAGGRRAREGIRQVMLERELACSAPEVAVGVAGDVKRALAEYGALLAEDAGRGGGVAGAHAADAGRWDVAGAVGGQVGARGGGRGGVEGSKHKDEGRLTEVELLRRRVRYFVDGLVIGSGGFVEAVFALSRGWFGAGRQSGARRLARAETALRSMRGLRVRLYG